MSIHDPLPSLLRQLIQPFILRRTKSEVSLSLPPKRQIIINVPLTPLQQALYRSVITRNAASLLQAVDDITSTNSSLVETSTNSSVLPSSTHGLRLTSVLASLKKICNHPYLIPGVEPEPFEEGPHIWERSGKFQFLQKILPALAAADHKVLIFSTSTTALDVLQDFLALEGYAHERLDGGIRGADRFAAVDRFQSRQSSHSSSVSVSASASASPFVFLLSTRAGGQGITLTNADTVIFFDSDYNPMIDEQAENRSHRIGQKKPVLVIRLLCEHTMEQVFHRRARRKVTLTQLVLADITRGPMSVDAANRNGKHHRQEDQVDFEVNADGTIASAKQTEIKEVSTAELMRDAVLHGMDALWEAPSQAKWTQQFIQTLLKQGYDPSRFSNSVVSNQEGIPVKKQKSSQSEVFVPAVSVVPPTTTTTTTTTAPDNEDVDVGLAHYRALLSPPLDMHNEESKISTPLPTTSVTETSVNGNNFFHQATEHLAMGSITSDSNQSHSTSNEKQDQDSIYVFEGIDYTTTARPKHSSKSDIASSVEKLSKLALLDREQHTTADRDELKSFGVDISKVDATIGIKSTSALTSGVSYSSIILDEDDDSSQASPAPQPQIFTLDHLLNKEKARLNGLLRNIKQELASISKSSNRSIEIWETWKTRQYTSIGLRFLLAKEELEKEKQFYKILSSPNSTSEVENLVTNAIQHAHQELLSFFSRSFLPPLDKLEQQALVSLSSPTNPNSTLEKLTDTYNKDPVLCSIREDIMLASQKLETERIKLPLSTYSRSLTAFKWKKEMVSYLVDKSTPNIEDSQNIAEVDLSEAETADQISGQVYHVVGSISDPLSSLGANIWPINVDDLVPNPVRRAQLSLDLFSQSNILASQAFQNCSGYIILNSLDNGGAYGSGFLLTSIANLSPSVAGMYERSSDLKDMKLGDAQMLPIQIVKDQSQYVQYQSGLTPISMAARTAISLASTSSTTSTDEEDETPTIVPIVSDFDWATLLSHPDDGAEVYISNVIIQSTNKSGVVVPKLFETAMTQVFQFAQRHNLAILTPQLGVTRIARPPHGQGRSNPSHHQQQQQQQQQQRALWYQCERILSQHSAMHNVPVFVFYFPRNGVPQWKTSFSKTPRQPAD